VLPLLTKKFVLLFDGLWSVKPTVTPGAALVPPKLSENAGTLLNVLSGKLLLCRTVWPGHMSKSTVAVSSAVVGAMPRSSAPVA
jgi:hypothetical protein